MAAATGSGSGRGAPSSTVLRTDENAPPVDESSIVHIKEQPSSGAAASNPAQRKVLFIYTGGTLGMKPREDGMLAPAPGYLTQRTPRHWIAIANVVHKHYLDYDGFVLMMGTDTMAYAASALSFLLENLGKTVVITGSMVPLAESYNDARRNVVVSALVAAYMDVPEVAVFMNRSLLRGNRTTKVHNAGLEAFESPNYPALARLTTKIVPYKSNWRPQASARLRVQQTWETHVSVFRLVPGHRDDVIINGMKNATELKAVVVQVLGQGTIGADKAPLLQAIKQAVQRGVVVVACSQCLKGRVSLDTYAAAGALATAGAIGARDMTVEAIVAKLGYLLGQQMPVHQVKRLLATDMRGELSPDEDQDEVHYSKPPTFAGKL